MIHPLYNAGVEAGHKACADQIERLQAENEHLRAALKMFVACAYPVSTEINPRGHAWRSESNLDCALEDAEAALGINQQSITSVR